MERLNVTAEGKPSRSVLLVALIVVAAAMSVAGCERVRSTVVARIADRALAPDHEEWLTDGSLHVILCGTGSPLALLARAERPNRAPRTH